MNDSDDYFSDDLVLDDQTLAALDQEESKFKRNVSNQRTLKDVSPPTKRQRTTGSCQPVNYVYRTVSSDDMDDLPDISVRTDGTYGLQDRQGPGPSRRAQVVSGPPALAQAGPGPTSAASLSRGPATRGRSVTGPGKVVQQPPRPPSVRATRVPPAPVLSQGITRSQSRPSSRVDGNTIQAASDAHVAALLRQVEELRKKNDIMQADLQKSHTELQAAVDAKFSKEGEVTHLRKRMEKTAQDHLAQLARLKAAKEDADAKQVLLQKQYEVDRERLRTEYAFKQHELEISKRKPFGSVPARRTARDIPPTPAPISSQMQVQRQVASAAGPKTPVQSPRRPRFGVVLDHDRAKRHPPPIDSRNLPSGFQTNALHSQTTLGDKGKGKAVPAISRSPISPQVGSHSHQPPISPQTGSRNLPSNVFVALVDDHIGMDVFAPPSEVGDAHGDVVMVDGTNPVMIPSVDGDEIEEVEPLNWNMILHRAMLMHLDKESGVSTLQLLMCAALSDEGQAMSYGNALSQILNVLASIPNHPLKDFVQNATAISQACCEIAGLLALNLLVPPLTALLCLLTHLTYIIPSFHGPLLSLLKSEDNTPHLLATLCGILGDLQTFEKACKHHILDSLRRQTLSLLEALTWNISVESEKSLELITCSPALLNALLQLSHPLWFLVSSSRLLLWLSTRPGLFHSLLSFPEFEHTKQDRKLSDLICLPQVDLMCTLLADIDQTGPEADEMKTNIITFFGMLSNVHPDAFTFLVESQALIPSVVIHLTNLVAPIWGNNEPVDIQAISRAISMISQATLLMDHLVTGGESVFSLRERLYRAPTRQYNGVVHMFIRTFGRLSFLDPPDWVNGQDKQQLEQVADLAKMLLELVVEGPEGECIWETYDSEAVENDGAQTEADDEEVEARRLELENV